MARPPKNFLARGFRVNHEKKSCGATLSVRAICFSIGTTLGAIGLFLPHNMATERGQHQEGKKGKKRPRHVMWQNLLHHCAVLTKVSEEFAPHYLAGIRHDMRQTTPTWAFR